MAREGRGQMNDGTAPTSRLQARVLALLLLAYIFNFLDRQILGILAGPIIADLKLDDAQFGAIGGLAFAPTLVSAVGTALLIGLLAGLSGAVCGALLQTQADPAYLGRVTAVSSLVSVGLTPLSMPVSAAAVGAWGTGPVFVVSAAVCALGGVVALSVRTLRRAELPR